MCKSSFHFNWGKSINGLGFNPLGKYTKYVCKIVYKVICVICTLVLHDPHKTFQVDSKNTFCYLYWQICVDSKVGNSWFDHDNTYIYIMCM
jgi:hypothetical protein